MPYTKENFDDWLSFLSDKTDHFTGEFAREQGFTLDYTPESLDALENWLLSKYEKGMDLVEDREPYGNDYRLADLCGIYVGEVYRRRLGGIWYMILDQPKNVYYKLPSPRYDTRIGPHYIYSATLATACIQRKRGNYMRWVLGNYIEERRQRASGKDLPQARVQTVCQGKESVRTQSGYAHYGLYPEKTRRLYAPGARELYREGAENKKGNRTAADE